MTRRSGDRREARGASLDFLEREDDAVSISGLDQDVRRDGTAAERRAHWRAHEREQIGQSDALVRRLCVRGVSAMRRRSDAEL